MNTKTYLNILKEQTGLVKTSNQKVMISENAPPPVARLQAQQKLALENERRKMIQLMNMQIQRCGTNEECKTAARHKLIAWNQAHPS